MQQNGLLIIPVSSTHFRQNIAQNVLSRLELLISRYYCIYLVVYIIYISLYIFETC